MYSQIVFYTTILHGIIKGGYCSRHIPDIRNIRHQILDMFQYINQYQVKSNEMSISISLNSQTSVPGA